MTAAVPATTDLKSRMEEMRASVVAEAEQSGFAAIVAAAVVRLLDLLVAMLADFRAGRFAAPIPGADAAPLAAPEVAMAEVRAAEAADAGSAPAAGWPGLWAWWRGKRGAAGNSERVGACRPLDPVPQGREDDMHTPVRCRLAGEKAARARAEDAAAVKRASVAAPEEAAPPRHPVSPAVKCVAPGEAPHVDGRSRRPSICAIRLVAAFDAVIFKNEVEGGMGYCVHVVTIS